MLSILVLMSTLVAGLFWPGALWAGILFTYQVASITEIDGVSIGYVILAGGVAVFHALRRPPPIAFGVLDAVFIVFVATYALTASYMPDTATGVGAAGGLMLSVVTMYIIGRLTCWPERLTQTVRELLMATVIVGTALAVIIFHSRTLSTVHVSRLAVGSGTDVGISGPFPFVLLAGVASLFYYFNPKQIIMAGIGGVSLLIVGYVSVYSATRGVYVAAVGGLMVMYFAGHRKIRLRGAITLGVLGLLGLIAVFPFLPQTVELQNAIGRLFANFHGGTVVVDAATLERLRNYRVATVLFLEHPLLGIGIGGFAYETGYIYVHNLFLEVACEFGIVGLCLLGVYLAVLFRSGFRLAETHPEAASILIGFCAVQLTHLLVSDTLAHAKVVFMFASTIAGALAATKARKTVLAPAAAQVAIS